MTTTAAIAIKPLTAADLLRLYSEGVRGELIQGEFHATAHPSTRTVNVYPESGARFTLAENDILDGGDVLPGFSWEVSDIFDV